MLPSQYKKQNQTKLPIPAADLGNIQNMKQKSPHGNDFVDGEQIFSIKVGRTNDGTLSKKREETVTGIFT